MQWSLMATFIPIVNILWCGASAQDCNYTSFLLNLGYSKECIDSSRSSLISWSNDEAPPHKECGPAQENITTTLTAVKTLLQMKSAEENSSSVFKSLLQKIMSDGDNSTSLVEALLQEIRSDRQISASEIKAILQEIKSEGEKSSSVVKSLLQEMKSEFKAIRQEIKSEIKVILQEVKRELENVTDNSQTRDCVIPGGTTTIPKEKELPKNCAELKMVGEWWSGVQTVYPYGSLNPKQTTVYCDQVTDGGGWTVIQSRSPLPIRENFQRNWDDYVEGFGDPNGEFWLGLDNIHVLTNSGKMELRIDLEDAEGEKAWALYGTFHVGDAASKYILSIANYSGDAGDGMTYPSEKDYNLNGMKFSTHDNDNDLLYYGNCAEDYKGGWWFRWCHAAHLNGLPIVGVAPSNEGILWEPFRGWSHSMKRASMRIRPVALGF